MKYKVGDRVKMHSLQWCKENIFNNEDKYPPELFGGIEKFCGKILTISDAVDKSKYVDEGYYNMFEDTKWDYYWSDEMIEGLVEEETKSKFKVGDKVRIKVTDLEGTVESIIRGQLIVNCKGSKIPAWPAEVVLIESVEEKTIIDLTVKGEEVKNRIEIAIPEGYEYAIESGKIIFTKKKKEYPKTYYECCKVLGGVTSACWSGYKCGVLGALNKLLICRDAYWQIAGEEMGLGKPWEPDWLDDDVIKYIISHDGKRFGTRGGLNYINYILAFPTEEMRDTFCNNFKEEIEKCKELL